MIELINLFVTAITLSEVVELYIFSDCKNLPDEPSFNVVGEIKGSKYPNEIIVFGGHLDSWDNGKGAHDDGAGCAQSIEVLRIFKALGIQTERTIRAVLFMNEENGLRGGKKYAELAKLNLDYLVTINPGCTRQLKNELKRNGIKTKVVHLAELVAKAK